MPGPAVTRRRFLSAAAIGSGALLLAACGGNSASATLSGSASPKTTGDQPDVPAALAPLKDLPPGEREKRLLEEARKEGKPTLYVSGSVESWELWKQAYEKKYGLSFDFLRGGSDELLEKILTEWRAKRLVPDLVDNSKMHILIDEGVVVPYTSPVKQAYPKEFADRYQASYDVNPIVIAYNTNLVKPEDAPKKWEDLLDAKWKGKKIALDLIPEITFIGLYRAWGEERGRDFMKKLVAQDLFPSRSHTTATDQMAAGEFPIVAEAYGYRMVEMKKKGAPVGYTLPDPMPTTAGGIAMTSTTRKPHASALLYDWMLSAEAGTLYGSFGRMPVAPGSELKYPDLQKPMLEAPTLKGLNTSDYRKWFPIVMKDIKEILQPAMGGGQ